MLKDVIMREMGRGVVAVKVPPEPGRPRLGEPASVSTAYIRKGG
jgi:hypothetical protein